MASTFRYRARTGDGKEVESQLGLPGIFPTALAKLLCKRVVDAVFSEVTDFRLDQDEMLRVPMEEVSLFTRRLAVMVGSGVPMHRSLAFLSDSESERMNRAAERLTRYVETGHGLSRAFGMLPGVFPPVFLGFIRAGEMSGRLVKCLESLATQLEKSVWMKRRVLSGLGYPMFLMLGAVLLSGLLIFGLVPAMAPALLELGVELPWLTQVLLDFTHYGSHPIVVLGVAILVFLVGTLVSFTFSATGRYSAFRRSFDGLILNVPILSKIVRSYASARILSATSMSVETGIPVVRALRESSTLAGNIHLENRVLKTCLAIGQGETFEQALEVTEPFRASEVQILICASEAGDLAKSMLYVSKSAEEELESAITALTTLFEPLILGLMSVIVGVVSLATFLPWVSLLQSIL